jgi:YbbR domain-containing protein
MRKASLCLLALVLFASVNASAQKKATISFATTEHDFGTFKEEAGNQS